MISTFSDSKPNHQPQSEVQQSKAQQSEVQQSEAQQQIWQEVRVPYGIGYRIKVLSQLLSRHLQDELDTYGLTPFHWLVLNCLWDQDGLATSVLGERLRQVGGTLTGVLDRMEERSLVRRERDANDRRIWRIWLTPAGQTLEATLPPHVYKVRTKLLQGFSESEQKQLSAWIDRMLTNLS